MKTSFKQAYSYLFYQLYKFWELFSVPKFWSDWKAELSIDVLEIFIGLSAIAYYSAITKDFVDFGDGKVVILIYFFAIATPNYFFFHHKEHWRDVISKFDKLPTITNKRGGVIVCCIIFIIIINLIFSFYLLSQTEWSNEY